MSQYTVQGVKATTGIDTGAYTFVSVRDEPDDCVETRLDASANRDRLERTAFLFEDESLEDYWQEVCDVLYGVRPEYYGAKPTYATLSSQVRAVPQQVADRMNGVPYEVVAEVSSGALTGIAYLPHTDASDVEVAVNAILEESGAELPDGQDSLSELQPADD